MLKPTVTKDSSKTYSRLAVNAPQSDLPIFLVILLLLVLPPAAWYMMWKRKRFHWWFPILLYIYAGAILEIVILQLYFVPLMLTSSSHDFSLLRENFIRLDLITFLTAFSLAQIALGVFLHRKLQTNIDFPRGLMQIAIGILVADYLYFASKLGIVVISTLYPIFTAISNF